MFISTVVCHLIVLCFLNSYHALKQLPKDIAATEDIRDVVNQIFSSLKLKTKQDSKLSEYSTIHKHFVGLTQLENESWKRLNKLTTIDYKIDNGTTDLTTVINEILNEENNTVEGIGTPNDDDVNEHIDNFLSTLAQLKEIYLVNDSYSSINTDVLEHFYGNSVSGNYNNNTGVDELNATEINNSTDELEFWTPTETRRIYRGKKTKIKYFPFLASVHMFNQFTCAGSLIESSLVITAASCLQLAYNNRFFRENPAFLAVRIGSPFFNGGGERIPVLEVYFHPTYTPRTLKDNIAIMRLEKIVKFRRGKRNVRKIEIDRSDWNMPVTSRGVTIAGWGAKTTSNKIHDPWSNKVSMAHLPIYPFEDCQDIYSKEYVTRKNFCAGFLSKGGGACNRDVGAPGVANGLLMGIASFGAPSCGTVDAPTVFTKVGFYHDWIETIMEQDVPHIKIRTTKRPHFIAQNIVPVVVEDNKKFKIDPIAFDEIKNMVDIRNVNRLGTEEMSKGNQNTKFQNFLGTMFNAKDQEDNKDKLPNVKRQKPNDEESNVKEANQFDEELFTTPTASEGEIFEPAKFVTSIDGFEPEPITSRETDSDVGMKQSELEKIAELDENDDDRTDDKTEALEKKGTTPILEEYGMSIELSDKQDDIFNYDSERKHQIDNLDESAKSTNESIKFNQDPNFQSQELKDAIDETLRDDSNHPFNTNYNNEPYGSFEDERATYQLSEKSQDELKQLEELVNEGNENNEYNKELAQQMAVSQEPIRSSLNNQTNSVQKLNKLADSSVKKEAAKVAERVLNQAITLKESKNINDSTRFNKQLKFQVEIPEESVKYKDVVAQLNKEHQHEAEKHQVNSEEDQPTTSDTIQFHTQLYDTRQRQIKESNHRIVEPNLPERHVDANTQTNKLHRLKQDKYLTEIDDNPFKKERKQQVGELDSTSKHARWQHQNKKPGKNLREFEYQEKELDLSEGYANGNTESKKIHHNQALKRHDRLLDATPFMNRGHRASERDNFERNTAPKFYTKIVHKIKEPVKFKDSMSKGGTQVADVSLKNEGDNHELMNHSHGQAQKLDKSKTEIIDKKLDEQIDQLLKNLDVENNIDSRMIDQSNDKKVIEDNTLLAFLLMTEYDRNKTESIKETAEYDEESEFNGKEGMTIDGEYYEDLTHRANDSDDSYKIMSKSEMYDILSDAVQADDAIF